MTEGNLPITVAISYTLHVKAPLMVANHGEMMVFQTINLSNQFSAGFDDSLDLVQRVVGSLLYTSAIHGEWTYASPSSKEQQVLTSETKLIDILDNSQQSVKLLFELPRPMDEITHVTVQITR